MSDYSYISHSPLVKSDVKVNLDGKMKTEKKKEWPFTGVKFFRLVEFVLRFIFGGCFCLGCSHFDFFWEGWDSDVEEENLG